MKGWIKHNRLELVVLLIILAIAAFLRFYRLPEYMTFLGDEGRDALMIKRILVEHDLPLLGPPTSIGNIYLGPLYYYMMAVAMAVWWLNPVAAAAMVAFIGVVAVGLVYYLAREWFGQVSAALAATLYAISPVNIIYSRSSWNPNPAPLFALLTFLGFYKAHQSKDFWWFTLSGISLAFAVQMHYLALILLPILGILYLVEIIQNHKYLHHLWQGTLVAVAAFLLLMSPLAIFDLKYNFLNSKAVIFFFTDRQATVNLNVFNSLQRTIPIYQDKLIGRFLTGENPTLTLIMASLILLTFVVLLVKNIAGKNRWSYWVLSVWLLGGLAGLSLYKQTIYDHYLGFLNPVPFLLIGGLAGLSQGRVKIAVALLAVIVLGWANLQKNPLQFPPNNQLQKTQEIAKFVIAQSGNQPFNFALIAKNNYDAAYQFYLDLFGHKPAVIPVEVADQLFVVCEDQVCNPVGHAKYEISGFGWAKIDWEQTFNGVKIYRLVPNPNGAPPI